MVLKRLAALPRRIAVAAPVVALAALAAAVPARGAPIACGIPASGKQATLTQNLSCSGNGIIAGRDGQVIDLNGHTISGAGGSRAKRGGSSIGIDFNQKKAVRIRGKGAVVSDFETGILLDGREDQVDPPGPARPVRIVSSVSDVLVEFPSGDGIKVPAENVDVAAFDVTVSNAGENGVTVFGTDASKNPVPTASFFGLTVFSSVLNGMRIELGSTTYVSESAFKQNGADGIVVAPAANGGSVKILDSRANYNVGWGIAGVRGVRSQNNRAIGNGQVRQCLIVECN